MTTSSWAPALAGVLLLACSAVEKPNDSTDDELGADDTAVDSESAAADADDGGRSEPARDAESSEECPMIQCLEDRVRGDRVSCPCDRRAYPPDVRVTCYTNETFECSAGPGGIGGWLALPRERISDPDEISLGSCGDLYDLVESPSDLCLAARDCCPEVDDWDAIPRDLPLDVIRDLCHCNTPYGYCNDKGAFLVCVRPAPGSALDGPAFWVDTGYRE